MSFVSNPSSDLIPILDLDDQVVRLPSWADNILKPGIRIWLGGHDVAARRAILANLTGFEQLGIGQLDIGIITPASLGEAVYFAVKLLPRLVEGGQLWLAVATEPDSCAFAPTQCRDVLVREIGQLGLRAKASGSFARGSLELLGFSPG